MTGWNEKAVLITGGGGGMGRAVAARFLEAGASVAIADLDPARVEHAVKELDPKGTRVVGVACNVTKVADCARMVAVAVGKFGRLDVLVAAAGIWTEGPSDTATEAEWDRVIDVNLKGVFFACRYAIPELEKTGGVIVNVASDAGLLGNAGAAIYCASKGGVVILTKSLALELAPRGIRAIAICPGDVETPMLSYQAKTFGGGDPAGYLKALRDKYPQKEKARFIQPDEIGELVFMAASPKLGALTGAAISFDFALSAGIEVLLARALIDQMIIDVGPEVFRQLATLYQQETRQAVQDIRRLAEAPADRVDWREIGRRAHSLKHAALSFGLNELAALAYRIEQAADAGDGGSVTRETSVLQAISEPNLAELAALVVDMRFK